MMIMGVPATTGQLRTRFKDMKIGDYISSRYIATTSGAIGVLKEFGTSTASEIPFEASATPDGTFYFVKVARGLLVADRVVQHSISWDALATARAIQRFPWDNGNIVPIMISNTSPTGTVSTNSSNNDAWKAFDGNTTSYFMSNFVQTIENPLWISYKFDSPKIINGYKIMPFDDAVTYSPKDWTFEGSNDGVNWSILHRYSVALENTRIFLFSNSKEFIYYRINIKSNGTSNYTRIKEFGMFEESALLRSLSGGVSYANLNGESSLLEQSYGAFPKNNEWESYVINFPSNKIQSGKTVSDIFNHLNVGTWVQETPILAIGASSNRVYRKGLTFNNIVSSTVGQDIGFRPVLEYIEI